ncbi:anthranilate synthase component I [Lachnospiraceae bacterium NSJ-143]|nr:anthranilate synthase component I [Lachnospiraceae bacterium NSJ-143]
MIRPALEEAAEIKEKYKSIPISDEILSDIITPMEALKILKSVSSHVYMLESIESTKHYGRYTFLGFDPKSEITVKDFEVTIRHLGDEALKFRSSHPEKYINSIIEQNRSPKFDYLPSFTGGLVGYFSYDYIKYAEPTLNLNAQDEEGFNDCDLMFFDKVIAFDNFRQKIVIIANAKTDYFESNYSRAAAEIEKIKALLTKSRRSESFSGRMLSPFTPLFTQEEYCKMVETAKERIADGDIFQVVLSNRLSAQYEGSLLNAYRVLRTINPSPYMFYFSSDDIEIAGSSPETLVKLEDGILHTFPLAGTRPRGRTDEEDKKLSEELLNDKKELAEHNMLVDLGRNDLGKISAFGTVQVERYHEIELFSHVMHIGSTVRGEIRNGYTATDAIRAVLPAGTLSGAPKIRACQIINDLENNKRGIYGGAIGYIDLSGNADTCIGIRLAFKKNGRVFVRSGAGIVFDSIPQNEYQECINKAMAVVKAIELSQEV